MLKAHHSKMLIHVLFSLNHKRRSLVLWSFHGTTEVFAWGSYRVTQRGALEAQVSNLKSSISGDCKAL